LADWCESLYFGFVVNPAVLPWPKDDAPGVIECILEASRTTCDAECAPLLPRLRQLYPSGGVKGWDRRAACGVDALLHFSMRLLMQAMRLRGVQVASAIGEERFEDIPIVERGYFAAMIEQDFALLRQSQEAAKGAAGREQGGADEADPVEESPPLGTLLSASDLADYLHKPKPRVESFLRRYRARFPDCCEENASPRKNEPHYLYRVADVLTPLKQTLAKRRK
jgi:hypothetical protein